MFQMSSTTKQQIDQAGSGAKGGNGFIGKILVVDDETELKGVLVESLIAQGFEATGYSSAQDALKALQIENFDLLLTDLMMPDMKKSDKFWIRKLRKRGANSNGIRSRAASDGADHR